MSRTDDSWMDEPLVGDQNAKATENQVGFLQRLCEQAGIPEVEGIVAAEQLFGVGLTTFWDLTKAQASELIEELKGVRDAGR